VAGGCIGVAARPRVPTRPAAISFARPAPSRGVDVLPLQSWCMDRAKYHRYAESIFTRRNRRRDPRRASVLQASWLPQGCHRVPRKCNGACANLACNLRFGGIRRNACTDSRRLITGRSRVQIPPRYTKALLGRALCLLHRRDEHDAESRREYAEPYRGRLGVGVLTCKNV
jgi:hypothetical protein